MKYRHTFVVKAPIETVTNFHKQAESMAAITPPPVYIQMHQAPSPLTEGAEIEFTLWLPLPVRWLARIEDVTPTGFTDRQLRGPFRAWIHRHTFVARDENTTEVIDEIEGQIRPHPLWGAIGWGMWLNLPLLFTYRAWKTRRLLESGEAKNVVANS